MRDVTLLVIHCTATPPSADIGLAEVDDWHWQRGWRSPSGIHCGYHYIIRRDGRVELGRPEHEQGAHAKRYNHNSLAIALVGGVDANNRPENNFTGAQMKALRELADRIAEDYPGITVLGHRDLPGVAKECPCFDVKSWWAGGAFKEPADLPKEQPWIPDPVIPASLL